MSMQLSIHFRFGLRVIHASVHPDHRFATLTLGEVDDDPPGVFPAHPQLFFNSPEQIDTLMAALGKLRDEFIEARPIELTPEPADPWKEKGETSSAESETPTDEIAVPIVCRAGCGADASPSRGDGLCAECGIEADKLQF